VPSEEAKILHIGTPIDGAYQIEVIGTGSGPYTLVLRQYDQQGDMREDRATGIAAPGSMHLYEFQTNSGFKGLPGDPNILSSYVFYADQFVKLDGITDSAGLVGSNGTVEISKGPSETLTGNLQARGNITVKGEITIAGDVSTNTKISNKGGALTVMGATTEGASLLPLTLPNPSFTAGGPNVEIPARGARTLPPGSYGRVKVNKGATLDLSSGNYFFKTLDTKPGAKILFDAASGPITVNVVGELDIDENVELRLKTGTTRDVTINALHNSIKIDRGATVRGTLIAPHAAVEFKGDCMIEGAVYARQISLRKGCTFEFHP
jgi:cytoskeletal protein CcmA (bactofilin family)